MLWIHLVPLPERAAQLMSLSINQRRIGIQQQRLLLTQVGFGFCGLKLRQSNFQAIDTPDIILIAKRDIGRLAGEQQAAESLCWTEATI